MDATTRVGENAGVVGGDGRGAGVLSLGVSGVAAVGWGLLLMLTVKLSVWSTPQPEPEIPLIHARLADKPAGAMLDAEGVEIGHEIYVETCIACHGPRGTGVQGLGKDLVHSDFILGQSDESLAAFIKRGRDPSDPMNTTGVGMPPKGGNPTLADQDMLDIVTYLRGLQDPRRIPAGAIKPKQGAAQAPAQVRAESEKAPVQSGVTPVASGSGGAAGTMAAPGDAGATPETIEHGRSLFMKTCAACHGVDAHGLPKMGKDLVASVFTKGQTDDSLVDFIRRGRDPGDPANTTKVAMPPRGGNPALSDDDLYDVVDYLRSLQRGAGGV